MEHNASIDSTSASARGLMDRVREGATAQLSSQKERATDGLGSLAQAVRQSTQPFRDQKQDVIAQYIERAADQLEGFSARLRDRDINDLVGDVQQFARRQPAMFIGAAFAAGVLAARFLKSSGGNRGYRPGSGGNDRHAAYGGRSSYMTEGRTSPQFAGGGL